MYVTSKLQIVAKFCFHNLGLGVMGVVDQTIQTFSLVGLLTLLNGTRMSTVSMVLSAQFCRIRRILLWIRRSKFLIRGWKKLLPLPQTSSICWTSATKKDSGRMNARISNSTCLIQTTLKLAFPFLTSILAKKWQLCAAMMSWVRRWVELVVYQQIQGY